MILIHSFFVFFFFKQKTAYEMRISDWSSDVCSSDLNELHRLMDGHEIAPDIGMGDGQRTAATKLPLEKRYQRPAGADDVAETHSEETRRLRIVLPLQIESLAIKFAKQIGRAHV